MSPVESGLIAAERGQPASDHSRHFSMLFKAGDWDGHSRTVYLCLCMNSSVDFEKMLWIVTMPLWIVTMLWLVTTLNIVLKNLLILGGIHAILNFDKFSSTCASHTAP